MYLNFHTHFFDSSENVKSIRNLIVGKDDIWAEMLQEDQGFSAGIHPWYLNEKDFQNQFEQLKKLAALNQVQVIGECGLDRLKGPSLNVQQSAFEAQIKLAEVLGKPVVIHCVKCFSELLAIKKKLNPKVPMVIHGFNNKPELGLKLLNAGFSFSIGAAILRKDSNASDLLMLLPDDKVFFETDDREMGIEKIYETAAEIRKTTVDQLKDTIFANWMSLLRDAAQSSF